jgi:hypothetical protein
MTSPDESDGRDPRQSPHFKAFEAQLAALRPREGRLDRETLMFLAGQASVDASEALRQNSARRWARPASVGALVGAAAAAAVMLAVRPIPSSGIAARPTPERKATVVAASLPNATPLPFDLASAGDPFEARLLTAGMALARSPRLLVAAERRRAADEEPTEAPASQPGLTTRSLREILDAIPVRMFPS